MKQCPEAAPLICFGLAWHLFCVLSVLAKVDEYGECLTKEAPFSNWKCSFLSSPAVSCLSCLDFLGMTGCPGIWWDLRSQLQIQSQ